MSVSSSFPLPIPSANWFEIRLEYISLFKNILFWINVQFSSVAQSCLTLCNPMDCSMPGLPVHHQLTVFTQIHVHWVGDAIQPSHPLSSPPTFNLFQHQGLFQWVNSSHEVAKVLEFQLEHHSFQRNPRNFTQDEPGFARDLDLCKDGVFLFSIG